MFSMPFKRGNNYYGEQVAYLTKADGPKPSAATAAWCRTVTAAAAGNQLPHVSSGDCVYESRSPFDAFTELERTATEGEIAAMLGSKAVQSMGDVLLFPEPRERQIRMTWRHPQTPTLPDLPHSWAVDGPSFRLDIVAAFKKGEFATFQVGLFAGKTALASVRIDPTVGASGFALASSSRIPQSALNCFNLAGVDNQGRAFNHSYSVPHLQTGALWFGLDIPTNATAGHYSGDIGLVLTSTSGEQARRTVMVSFDVTDATAYRGGDGNLTRMTRTRWINSRAGETDAPAVRHAPLVVNRKRRTLQTWSTLVELDASGLPRQLTRVGIPTPTTLLAGAIRVFTSISTDNCGPLAWRASTPSVARWEAHCTAADSSGLVQTVAGSLDADGTLLYDVTLSSEGGTVAVGSGGDDDGGIPDTAKTVDVSEVNLVVPLRPAAAPYSMGLGRQGDRIASWDWRWWVGTTDNGGTGFQNNMVWVGDVHQGMRIKLLGDGADWLGALHTVKSAADIPPWGGVPLPPSPSPTPVGGQDCGRNCVVYSGGMRVAVNAAGTNVTAFRGANATVSSSAAGMSFKFELLLTPSVRLNTTAHFGNQGRYWQFSCTSPADPNCQGATGMNAEKFLAAGVRVVNVHQGVPVLNPYINYPFEPDATEPLSTLAKDMHAGGGRMKMYYTTRELSNHAAELWFLRALGDEIIDNGGSGGASWLQEHLNSNYSVCWSTPSANIAKDGMLDAAICDAQSHDLHQRWSNYYVAGLDWLVSEKPHMDGLYLDGIAYDRITLKRCRKVMDSAKDGCLIDIHSGNNLHPQYGMVSPALQYMMLFPYMDSSMFGEGYQAGYDRPADTMQPIDGGGPDWWLIEVSSLAWGMMNDMLGGKALSLFTC